MKAWIWETPGAIGARFGWSSARGKDPDDSSYQPHALVDLQEFDNRAGGPGQYTHIILARRIKIEDRNREWISSYYRENMDPAFEFALRNLPAAGGCHVFMPPSGQTWEQLQDFRTSYSQMADMLADWLLGRRIPKPMEALVSTGSDFLTAGGSTAAP